MIARPDGSPGAPPDEPRQRWRIVFARDAPTRDASARDAPSRDAPARDAPSDAAAWEAALAPARLPIARTLGKTPRPRLTVGAALPVGMSAEAELADLVLTERLPIADVRPRLAGHLPDGHRLVDLYDVWLGAPALTAQLVAADYRMVIRGAPVSDLAEACTTLMAAASLERSRQKGDGRAVGYDLRPLILGLTVIQADPSPPVTLRMRLRQGQAGPAGRPDELVLALAESLKRPLEPGPIIRERLLTADMLEDT